MRNKTFTVGAKIILLCVVSLLAVGVVSGISFVTIGDIKSSFHEMESKHIVSKVATLEINRDINYISRLTRNIMLGANFEKDSTKLNARIDAINDNFKILQTASLGSDTEALVGDAKKAAIDFVEDGRQFVIRLDNTPAEERYKSYPEYGKSATPYAVKSRKHFGDLLIHIDANFESALKNFQTAISRTRIIIASVFVLVAFTLCVTSFIVMRSITRPLNLVIEDLTSGAEQGFTTSSQVSSSSQTLSDGASQQAAAIEETSSSMEEMSAMTKQNADNALEADNLMNQTLSVMKTAETSMDEMSASMEEISVASDKTSKIVKTIDEIAFQTNLLALNAAVEAARAGEAGAGFAVVADEVRNLAMRATEAAKNTNELIDGIVQKVEKGKQIVIKTNAVFSNVAENGTKVGGLVGKISIASQEQAQGFTQINQAILQMDKVTQQNSASAEESAEFSEEFKAQAGNMMNMVMDLKYIVGGGANNIAYHRQSNRQSASKETPSHLQLL